MTIFEYLLVLISIIVGLGIAHILSGIGRIVSHPGRRKVYWVHLLWVGWAFLWLVFFWWFEFARSMTKVWTPTTYLFLVLYAVLLYLFCVIVLPSEAPDGADYRRYYYSRRRWIFMLLLGVIWVDMIDSWTLVDPAQRSVLWAVIGVSVLSGHGLIAAGSKKERFHAAFGALALWVSLSIMLWGDVGPQAIDGQDPNHPAWARVVTLVLCSLVLVSALSIGVRPLDRFLGRVESGVLKLRP